MSNKPINRLGSMEEFLLYAFIAMAFILPWIIGVIEIISHIKISWR